MKTLADIRHDLATGRYELTQQAFRQAIEQDIGDEDLRDAADSAVILEEISSEDSGNHALLGLDDGERGYNLLVSRADRERYHCQTCGSSSALGEVVDEIFRFAGQYVLVENIPANVCELCGDKLYSPVTTAKLQILLRSSIKPSRGYTMIAFDY